MQQKAYYSADSNDVYQDHLQKARIPSSQHPLEGVAVTQREEASFCPKGCRLFWSLQWAYSLYLLIENILRAIIILNIFFYPDFTYMRNTCPMLFWHKPPIVFLNSQLWNLGVWFLWDVLEPSACWSGLWALCGRKGVCLVTGANRAREGVQTPLLQSSQAAWCKVEGQKRVGLASWKTRFFIST